MRDTAHLSLIDHGAYTMLLDTLYATGKPLPADLGALYRICGALTKSERQAVDKVAEQFFPINGDGSRHNSRADEELAKAVDSEQGDAARRDNERERQRRHRQHRKEMYERLRALDIVPSFDATTQELYALLNCNVTQSVTLPVTRDITANHSHSHKKKKQVPLPDGFGISDRVAQWAEEKKIPNLQTHLENFVSVSTAKGYRYADWDEAFMRAVRDDWAKVGNGVAAPRAFPL